MVRREFYVKVVIRRDGMEQGQTRVSLEKVMVFDFYGLTNFYKRHLLSEFFFIELSCEYNTL